MKLLAKHIKQVLAILCVAAMMMTIFAGCSNNGAGGNKDVSTGDSDNKAATETGNDDKGSADKGEEVKPEEPYKITFMTQVFETDPMPDDSPVMKKLEEYTNTDIEMTWVPSTTYGDKLNITLASGDLPMVMLAPSRTPSIINACRSGAFWEIGPYFKDYPNLSQANPIVLNNISIDGKVYGIYRARNLGRYGIVYRKDWLDNVGLSTPKTIDEFYNMMKAFTYQDPDQNGKDDTYGIVVPNPSKYDGPFQITSIWFGAPNKWGENEQGELVPAFFTDEYMECLRFWKKLYDEKLINQDFAVYDPGKWSDPYYAGKAGVYVDCADFAGRWENGLEKAGVEPNLEVIGAVEGSKGLRNLPTSGYSGMFVISKSGVKTEDDLKRVLKFMDQLNDKEIQDLLGWGIEGRHYNLVNGEIEPIADLSDALKSELYGANQMLMFIPNIGTPRTRTEIRKMADQVMQENEKIVIGNPAEPFVSDVYAQKGPQLDDIIIDSKVKYIVGQIDENGFKEALELWKRSGGDDYIKEINDLYKEVKN